MRDKLNKIKNNILAELERTETLQQLEDLHKKYFSRKSGDFSRLIRDVKNVSQEMKPMVGKLINEAKKEVEASFNDIKESLSNRTADSGESEFFDPTLPGVDQNIGTLHPITQVKNDLNDAFKFLGFEIYEGPEITSEGYEFDNLNFPPDHPARESMDTYWIKTANNKQLTTNKGIDKLCLRPHLTGASVRYMQTHQPPFRFVYPGRVFRSEATDAGHERCFYQYEALIVNERVSIAGGKILVKTILERVFGREVRIRMRTGFFPFVEPGFEIDMECLNCLGKGCSVCKHKGWVEMMPGGPPHPNVLQAGGIDPEKWQGFYINIGLDRLAMMKYGIDDIRLMHSGDLRFLRQF